MIVIMKNKFKIVMLCFCILCLSGCSILDTKKNLQKKEESVQKDEEKNFVEPYVDDNPIQLGLYLNQNNSRSLINTYDSDLTMYTDIVSLETYYTQEELLASSNQKNLWNQYYQNYSNIDSYKIGYQIQFTTNSLEVNKTILKPSDVESFFDYIQVYLYDDIHQDDGWYDHITEEEVTEETRFTSIKLTASTKIAEIISPIVVTVFTYDDNDFAEDGSYRGNSRYQITINKS